MTDVASGETVTLGVFPPGLAPLRIGGSLFVIFSLSCGVVTYRDIYASRQPNGSAQLVVREKCGLADCSIQAVIFDDLRTSNRIAERRGCNLNFGHSVWDGTRVAAFIDGGSCLTIELAYDVATKKFLPFAPMEAELKRAIIRDYAVTPVELNAFGGDVFAWAISIDGAGSVLL